MFRRNAAALPAGSLNLNQDMALGAFIRQVRVLERHVPHRYAKIHTPDRPHMKNIVVKGLLILLAVAALTHVAAAEEKPLSRICFGSCAKENKPQPIWNAIVEQKPELFLFIGDNIYGDSRDVDVLRAKYEKLFAKPGFAILRETCKLLATWDDHDCR